MEGCFRYKGQNFGENLHHVLYTGLFGYVDWLLMKYFLVCIWGMRIMRSFISRLI